jgi:hypothetical protein
VEVGRHVQDDVGAAAEVLLAVFMGSILVVWAVELLDHAGILPGAGHRAGLRYS